MSSLFTGSNTMLSDCVNRVLSEDYTDYIVEYELEPDEALAE